MWRVNFHDLRFVLHKTKVLSFVLLFVLTLFSGAIKTSVYAINDDYPSIWRNVPMDSVYDNWKMLNRECTSFVAWRLHARNGFEIPFFDNAYGWRQDSINLGYKVDSTPGVGSVAWTSGHVAWVESISGSYVTIEEYNEIDSNHNGIFGDDGTYSERTVSSNSFQYIHFKDIQQGTSSTKNITEVFDDTNTINPGSKIIAGHYIASNNLEFALVMQTDGNLVIYADGGHAIWSSKTSGKGGKYVVMQGDGNLVMYNSSGKAIWHTYTYGKGQSRAIIQDDGNFVVYDRNNSATWHSHTYGHNTHKYFESNALNPGQTLLSDFYIRSSDKKTALLLQSDGNLVMYGAAYQVIWHSHTNGSGAVRLVMQGDGNLVMYNSSGKAVWHTHTYGNGPSRAIMQSDQNFVTYRNSDNKATWASRYGRLY